MKKMKDFFKDLAVGLICIIILGFLIWTQIFPFLLIAIGTVMIPYLVGVVARDAVEEFKDSNFIQYFYKIKNFYKGANNGK